MNCVYWCSVALPHCALGWSAMCNCGISWSYLPIFFTAIFNQIGLPAMLRGLHIHR